MGEAERFAQQAARGIDGVECLTGRCGRMRLRFELCSDGRISAARGRTIRLPAYRVRNQTAPYLHEIAHALLPCPGAPVWFSEGLACYVESAVAERFGGYDSRLFTARGNAGVDVDARAWLDDARGHAVLRFVGKRGEPPRMAHDRPNVAAPFYVLSHSLVRFIALHAGDGALARVARARGFVQTLKRATGRGAAEWRRSWLAQAMKQQNGYSSNRNVRGG